MARSICTLDDAARHSLYLEVICEPCDRKALFATWELVHSMKRSNSISALRFRCVACGSRKLVKRLIDCEYAITPESIIWRPVKVRE